MFSKLQKSRICIVARQAFDKLTAAGQIAGVTFDDWRREEVERVVGRHGLTDCDNAQFNPLLAHFLSLIGEDGRALNALVREQTEPRRQAEFVLVRAMKEGGFGPAYVQSICTARFKCEVTDATPEQMRSLTIVLRYRARSKARKGQTT